MHRGPLGTIALNGHLQALLNPAVSVRSVGNGDSDSVDSPTDVEGDRADDDGGRWLLMSD